MLGVWPVRILRNEILFDSIARLADSNEFWLSNMFSIVLTKLWANLITWQGYHSKPIHARCNNLSARFDAVATLRQLSAGLMQTQRGENLIRLHAPYEQSCVTSFNATINISSFFYKLECWKKIRIPTNTFMSLCAKFVQ